MIASAVTLGMSNAVGDEARVAVGGSVGASVGSVGLVVVGSVGKGPTEVLKGIVFGVGDPRRDTGMPHRQQSVKTPAHPIVSFETSFCFENQV